MSTKYELSCDCGAVRLWVWGRPKLSAYFHGTAYRRLFGVEVLLASIWPHDSVQRMVSDTAEVTAYRLAGQNMWRYHCSVCGRLMHGRNIRDEIIIPNVLFREAGGGRLPAIVKPEAHCHYGNRVLEIVDELPRHALSLEVMDEQDQPIQDQNT